MTSGPGPRGRRHVAWSRLDAPGQEAFTLFPDQRIWHLHGVVHTAFGESPAAVRYGISCRANWTFARCDITMRWREGRRHLALVRDPERGWVVSGRPRPDLSACVDVDLSITPSTNTIPVRRLHLEAGESAEVTAAWVRFPELAVEPLPQRYTRLEGTRHRYESLGSGFTAILETDADGLVVTYPGFWARA